MDHQPQPFFTLEENLIRYRTQVTSWYCEDHKTVQEIVQLLRRDGVPVTESQIQQCLVSWSILRAPYIALAAVSNMNYSSDHELGPASSSSGVLPTHSSLQIDSSSQKQDSYEPVSSPSRHSPSRLKVKCYHGLDHHEAETTLACVPKGPSQIEMYVAETWAHEERAVRFEKNGVNRANLFEYRRAGVAMPSVLAGRRQVRQKMRRKNKKDLVRRREMANEQSQSYSAPGDLR